MIPRRLIQFGFYLLYHQLAWSYEAVAWLVSFGQWAAWRRLALLYMEPGPTLELASGTGFFLGDMLAAGYGPVGIDFSPYMARLAARNLRRRGLPLPLSRARAQALPFPSGHFRNVVATFPSEYILDPATLAEIERVLAAKGGRLIVVAEGKLRGPWPLRPFIEWLYRITGQRDLPLPKPLHRLAGPHLQARWETVDHRGAAARLLIAEKG